MAGRIRDEDVAAVRERSPIHEVVGERLQLRNAGGGSLKGLCPFHDEKSPSFNVTPARGLWYCFGCAEGGDVIRFVEKIENLTFSEAVEQLAARAGIELRYEQGGYVPGKEQSRRRRLLDAHQAAAQFYAERLVAADAGAGRAFLSQRGFERADWERFGVGYAPADWDQLVRHLRGRGFTDQELLLGGLAKEGRRGPIDRFHNRLIWPIRDVTGDVLAFGARKLAADEDGPKYLNTPETPLFKKSSVLYGADLAKREIGQRRQAVIVEGYTDVMACHLAGVPTAVATSGTSFGDGHIKILRRLLMDQSEFKGEVVFTFDGDSAGQRAALRAFEMEQKFVTQTFVAVQPDGLDPCDLRLAHGDGAVRDLVARRVPLFEFAIRSALGQHNLETTEGRLAALDAAAPLIAGIKDRGLRQLYAVNLDRWLGLMNERFVLARVREHAGDRTPAGKGSSQGRPVRENPRDGQSPNRRPFGTNGRDPRGSGQPYDLSDPTVQIERQALKLAVQHPALLGPEFDGLDGGAFTVPLHAAVRELIAACGGVTSAADGQSWAARLRDAAPDDHIRAFVTMLAVEPLPVDRDPDDRYASAVLTRIEELAVTRDVVALKARVQRMSPVEQQADYNRLYGDLIALEQQARALRDRASGAF